MPVPQKVQIQLIHLAALLVPIVVPTILQIIHFLYIKESYHILILSSEDWIQELLYSHPSCIQCELDVSRKVFQQLITKLYSMEYTNSRYITLKKQLAIFIYTCITDLTI